MLRFAGEGHRNERFAGGEPPCGGAEPPDPRSLPDLRSLVVSAVVPRLAEKLASRQPADRLKVVGGPRPRPAQAPAAQAPAAHLARGNTPDESAPGEDGVADLVGRLLRDDFAAICRSIESARAEGRRLASLYLDLLAPAAAAVGRLVAVDGCSTAAATLAFCNLQLVLRRYAADFYGEHDAPEHGRRALLVPARAVEGAANGAALFRLLLAADFLRRDGWEAWTEHALASSSIAETMASRRFDLLGVVAEEPDGSGPDESALAALAAGIAAVRRVADPRLVVVACGAAFAGDDGLAKRVGADEGAADALAALSRVLPFSDRDLARRRLA